MQAPRLLGLYRDGYDENGDPIGWVPIGWAIDLPGRGTITTPLVGPIRASIWLRLEHATETLDAYVDEISPRRHLTLMPDPQPTSRTRPRQPMEGTQA